MSKCDFNLIEIAPRHGFSLVNLRHIFRKPFPRNTSGWLLLLEVIQYNTYLTIVGAMSGTYK